MSAKAIKLGDEVRDKVSQFRGIATCECRWLNGCVRWVIQPKVDKDGKLPDAQTFDVGQLEVLREGKYVNETPETGGPIPTPRRCPTVSR